jgi:uncharacterized membrane protein
VVVVMPVAVAVVIVTMILPMGRMVMRMIVLRAHRNSPSSHALHKCRSAATIVRKSFAN